jgi:hypothetical protein
MGIERSVGTKIRRMKSDKVGARLEVAEVQMRYLGLVVSKTSVTYIHVTYEASAQCNERDIKWRQPLAQLVKVDEGKQRHQ